MEDTDGSLSYIAEGQDVDEIESLTGSEASSPAVRSKPQLRSPIHLDDGVIIKSRSVSGTSQHSVQSGDAGDDEDDDDEPIAISPPVQLTKRKAVRGGPSYIDPSYKRPKLYHRHHSEAENAGEAASITPGSTGESYERHPSSEGDASVGAVSIGLAPHGFFSPVIPDHEPPATPIVRGTSLGPDDQLLVESDAQWIQGVQWPNRGANTLKGRKQTIFCDHCVGPVHWACAGLEDKTVINNESWTCLICEANIDGMGRDESVPPIMTASSKRCLRPDCILHPLRRSFVDQERRRIQHLVTLSVDALSNAQRTGNECMNIWSFGKDGNCSTRLGNHDIISPKWHSTKLDSSPSARKNESTRTGDWRCCRRWKSSSTQRVICWSRSCSRWASNDGLGWSKWVTREQQHTDVYRHSTHRTICPILA